MPVWMVFVEWGARCILLLLAGLSVWSVSIMIQKNRELPAGENASAEIEGLHRKFASLQSVELVERSYRAYWIQRKSELDRGLTVLASLSSTAPFIGLFGTVLGIIEAFGALSQNQNNTASVMASISEALVATAVGLFVAIPASVGFNVFQRRLRAVQTQLEVAKENYILKTGFRNLTKEEVHGDN